MPKKIPYPKRKPVSRTKRKPIMSVPKKKK